MDTDFQKGLVQASQHHQMFMNLTLNKGNFNAQEAAHHVQTAENIYSQLLNEDMENSIVRYQLATLYMQTNRSGLAVALLKPLCENKDAKIEWLNNLGASYRNEHYNEEARAAFLRGLALQENVDILANLTALAVNEGHPEQGIPFGRRCLELEPEHNQGRWNLGLLLLENKDYEEGFKHYAEGFFTGERIVRRYQDKNGYEAEFWLGENLDDKTIVFHGEQGIGDELLFLQFIPEFVKEHPKTRVILDVHPRLCTLIQRSFPEIKDIFPTRKSAPEWNNHLRVDYKDGIGSLPRWYHKTRRKNAGWLKPDPDLVDYYKGILKSLKEVSGKEAQPVIGIAWSGGKKKTRNELRSIPLKEWLPILDNDCTFVSLEYLKSAQFDTGELLKQAGIYVHHWPDVVEGFDYEHEVALAAACDLVICVNTSMVHVMGSMDRICWTLTPHGHAWRYGKKDKINPFYNSVIQYHQDEGQDWSVVVNKVAKDLKDFTRKFK